ncbi:type IX secretion system periplasmic lipoprotein PorW/SprE [Lacibacter cauensis]|nr:tetratricopeptide repeat protein [Lacibacter cauensis]
MQPILVPKFRLFFFLFLLGCFSASAQPDFTLPLVKPKKYENKTLGSEKTDEKKFTLPRKIYQSTVTHYNFYYNATNKINAILERAKASHRDDYTQLLPFYNYSTNITAADSAELDSVIYKATAGIVLHDLRNSYIDDMYLLIGKSYYYWQKYDSAYRIFQFINYNFFPKGKDEYIIVVGANDRSTKGDLNIATKEKNSLLHRAFTKAPSRNDALLWLARTYAEDNLFPETYSLVNLLKKDPTFPKRLHGKLNEVQAYSFYKQEQWDSTAFYLKNALSEAADKTELARWEYLLAQLYAKTNQPDLASDYFNKAKAHTTDPVLYIHARIYEAQLVKKEGATATMDETLADLLKLSKKERFDGYEDVLFYAAANAALQKGDTTQAMNLLKRSVTYQTENPSVKNQAFVQLSELAYRRRDYILASSSLDSANLNDPAFAEQSVQLQNKQQLLKQLVQLITVVKQQDSLQTVAKMPEKEMDSYLRSLARKLRRERGLKEEMAYTPAVLTGNPQDVNTPLFTNAGSGNSWYFYNASQKAKGFNEFKAKWGNRPNIDNWRRQSAVDATASFANNNKPQADVRPGDENSIDPNTIPSDELTVDGLKSRLPLTEEQVLASNKKIAESLFEQGQIYKNQLEDYAQAAAVFEELWKRFGNYEKEEEVLFELFYCYNKLGDKQRAAYFQQELKKKYPNGDPVQKITAANNPVKPGKDEKTIVYERVYDLFISGKFDEAAQQKKLADSVYGNSYWTPQLLYIEALYHIKQKNDSVAIVTLTNLERNFPGSPMADKAAVMKDVVSRRAEIEDYLTRTNIVRQTEDSIVIPFDEGPKVNKIVQDKKQQDNKIVTGNQPTQNNANITRPAAPVQKTEVEKTDRNNASKIGINPKTAKDTTTLKPMKEVKVETAYIYNSNEPYTVLIYFDQVDPVYISEAKNAFQRYNNASHSGETIGLKVNDADKETLWMEMGMFSDVTIAMGYMDEWKKNARQIIPWLTESKYKFIVISERNLELLKTRKNMEEYRLFLQQHIKDKF